MPEIGMNVPILISGVSWAARAAMPIASATTAPSMPTIRAATRFIAAASLCLLRFRAFGEVLDRDVGTAVAPVIAHGVGGVNEGPDQIRKARFGKGSAALMSTT